MMAKSTYEGIDELDWEQVPEIEFFCSKCKDSAKKLIYDNARLESDMLVFESEINRIIEAAQFKRSDELFCGRIEDSTGPLYLDEE